jgi:hypothetical protein
MQQLPKIAREQLQATLRSGHPDADMLTAFAELALPASERALVMEHLGRCGDCREVIALALPEMEEATPALILRRSRWDMPVLRWGAITTALVMIATLGAVHYREYSAGNLTAKLENPARQEIDAGTQPSAVLTQDAARTSAPSAAAQETTSDSVSRDEFSAKAANARPMYSDALVSAPSPGNGRLWRPITAPAPDALNSAPKQSAAGKSFLQNNAAASPTPASPKVPVQTEAVEVARAAPVISTQQSSLDSSHDQEQANAQPLPLNGGSITGKSTSVIARAKNPVMLQTGSETSAGAVSGRGPSWMITSAGGLQKSYDQGKSWQDIPVTTNPTFAATSLQAEVSSQSQQKAAKRSYDKEQFARPVIRAIFASDLEIWAGASGGVLYHSLDAGDHWTSAIPAQGGVVLTGDIVSVQFSDVLHGKITTSTTEVWISADDGQHWSRQ